MVKEKNEIVKSEKKNEVAFKKDFSDSVMNSISQYEKEGRLRLPKNYSASNALKSAWLMLQNIKDKNGSLALQRIWKENPTSVANALLEMVIMGLNPAKSQCYFIVYGNTLSMMPSYFGKITALKRIEGIEEVNAQVIYEGDEIDYDIQSDGSISNIDHKQDFSNIKEDKIIGGYCVIKYKGKEYGTIATFEQIKEAWQMSKQSKDHDKFKSEFVKRTMVNKAIKWFVNTRDDDDLLIEIIQSNENSNYDYEEYENESTELPEVQEVKVETEEPVTKEVVKEAVYEEKIEETQEDDSEIVEFE